MQHSHSDQLETIKTIQYNLLSLKSRLNFFHKEQSRCNERMEKLFDSSIPIIKNKILETQNIIKTKNSFYQLAHSKIQKTEQIKASKIEHQNQMEKNKMEITRSKIYGSLYIREMSKKNQKIIEEAKKEWIEEKKKKSEIIKACRMQSRRKIEEFHTLKQNEFKKLKQEESEQLEKRINDISLCFAQVLKTEEQQQKKYETNEKTLQKLRQVVHFIQTMRPEVFGQIKQKLNLTEKSVLSDDVIENILKQAQKRSKKSAPEALRLSLDESKRKLNRYKSEQSNINSIYVYGPLKKIR